MKDNSVSMFVITALLCGTLILLISLNSPTGADTAQVATATFNVIGNVTELAVTKTDNPDPVFSGATLSYFITIENTGTATAFNITVDDIYPGNVTFNGSSPPPTTGNNIFFLGNLTPGSSTTVNITVNVSSSFTGILNNTVIVNFTNQSGQNETPINTSILTTVIAQPVPSPGGGGGGGAKYVECAPLKKLERNGQSYYTCCIDSDCQSFWKLPGNYACVNIQAVLAVPVCAPVAQLEMPAPSKGICPTVRTCGSKCCSVGETCLNGQCLTSRPVQLAPAPVTQPEAYYVVGVKETSLLWMLLLILLAIIILVILIIWSSFKEEKKKKKKRKKK